MCLLCDGYTEEDLDRQQDLAIRVHGYTFLQIYDPDMSEDVPADMTGRWTYTIGLNENFDHPDLICLQVQPDVQRTVIAALGDAIVEDGFLDPAVLLDLDVQVVPAHEGHFVDGLVGQWEARHGGRLPMRGEFLQIIPGASWRCACCAGDVQRMDSPAPLVGLGYQAT